MTANQQSNLTLDDVLHQILLAAESRAKNLDDYFDDARLKIWANRYPEFRQEIADFFVQESLSGNLPESDFAAAEETQFTGRSQELLDWILSEQQNRVTGAAKHESIQSLQAAAAEQNLDIPRLAQKTGLSRQLLVSLEQRLVKPATISRKLKTRLADALQTSIESLENYFSRPVGFLPGASYKSAEQPQLGEQQDFVELVKQDLKLTAEQKQALLD